MSHRPQSLPIAATLALAVVLTACGGPTASPTATEAPASEPATASPEVSATASASAAATAAPSASDDGSGFAVLPNPDADALFVARDGCDSIDDGFRLEYPDAWFTNTAVGDTGPCAWYAPASFEVDDPDTVPDGVVITVEIVDEDLYGAEDAPSREEGVVGETQNAIRFEEDGTYTYLVQLGPPGEGPTLVASTSTEMGGDYELNKAVLDRMIATMEFIGSVG